MRLITSVVFVVVWTVNAYSQNSNPVRAESGRRMDPDVSAFLQKLSNKHISDIILPRNVTQYNTISNAEKSTILTVANYADDEIMGHDTYTLSYTGSIDDLVVKYKDVMGQNVTMGTVTKSGDHYVLVEISCGTVSCGTIIYQDGVKVFEK